MQLVLWRHSVLTGVIAMALNKNFNLGFIGEEFTAGLIHDIGRSLFGVIAPSDFAAADPLDFEETGDFMQRERNVLRTDHCELGSWFVAHNKLPEVLVEVVRLHHSPGEATENRKLVATTAVADHMANYLQRHGTADGYEPQENSAVEILFEGSTGGVEEFSSSVQAIMADALRESNSPTGPFGLS